MFYKVKDRKKPQANPNEKYLRPREQQKKNP